MGMETGRDALGIRALNRQILEQIVAASPAGVLVAAADRPDLRVVYANAAYEQLTGYTLAELAGQPWAVLARVAAGDEGTAALQAAIAAGEPCSVSISDLRKDGTPVQFEVSAAPLRSARGEVRFFLLSHSPAAPPATPAYPDAPAADTAAELQTLGRARQKIVALDRIDPVTGLVRFPYFRETLRRDLAMARRDRRFVTLLVFEIVEFAVYRQTFGDKAADSCQRMIGAQIMRVLRRAGDICARYEDGILVAAVIGQHAADVQPLADRIADSVAQLRLHNPRAKSSRYISTRVLAIGCPPGAHDDPEPLIARALADARGNDVKSRAASS
jgi:diguanylate cyclase (GGDEF)-like protein/PAS domain S-box-containing protein